MGKRRYKLVDLKEFTKVYLECDFNTEVAEKLGIHESQVTRIATKLRQEGVKLPKRVGMWQDTNYFNPNELNDLIRDFEAAQENPSKDAPRFRDCEYCGGAHSELDCPSNPSNRGDDE